MKFRAISVAAKFLTKCQVALERGQAFVNSVAQLMVSAWQNISRFGIKRRESQSTLQVGYDCKSKAIRTGQCQK